MAKADFGNSLISTRLDLSFWLTLIAILDFRHWCMPMQCFGCPDSAWLCALQNLYFVFLIMSFNKVISTWQFALVVLCRSIA